MKKIILLLILLTSLGSYSQTPPPPPGVDESDILEIYETTRYDYYPNLEAYYDHKTGVYLYKDLSDNMWVETTELPLKSRGYSLSNVNHVAIAIEYKGDTPYDMINEHKKQFPANYSSRRQKPKDVAIASK